MSKQRPCDELIGPKTHAAIAAHYAANGLPDLKTDLAWYGQPLPFKGVLTKAANARDAKGKRHPHQWRLPKTVSPSAATALINAQLSLRNASDFAQLHSTVQICLRGNKGAGPLYQYDTALRIAASLGSPFQPQLVYLHAGARIGAENLLQRKLGATVQMSSFPAEFQSFAPHEMENLLCCYCECIQI